MKPGADPGAIREAIGEHPADRDGRVGERRRAGKPVRRADVGTDRRSRQCRTSGRASAKIKVIRPAVATTSPIRWPRVTRSLVANSKALRSNITLASTAPADATDALRHGVEPERRRGDAGAGASAQQPISRRHRGIEVCAGDRSEHQDQNGQSEHRGGRILEQLQSDVVRRKLRRCDAGSYNDRNQEGGANELGEQRPIQPLHREPTAARSGPSTSESCCSASDTTR